jgi:hypothetical protein
MTFAHPNTSLDEVVLTLPAKPAYVRLARLTAAGFASRLGLSVDDVEDLRIAVDELCYLLVGPDGHAGSVELRYSVENDHTLLVDAQAIGALGAMATNDELSREILGAVTDGFRVWDGGAMASFRLDQRLAVGAR